MLEVYEWERYAGHIQLKECWCNNMSITKGRLNKKNTDIEIYLFRQSCYHLHKDKRGNSQVRIITHIYGALTMCQTLF